MNLTETMTIQEAANAAGFDDYMLENGGGIRSWDNGCARGIVYSDEEVYARATLAFLNREQRAANE